MTEMSNVVAVYEGANMGMAQFNIRQSLAQTRDNLEAVKEFVANAMIDGIDYGKVPGCGDRSVLLKPGAEKMNALFNTYPSYEIMSFKEDFETGLAFYRIKCQLINRATNRVMGEGIGSCSTYEGKYRWRWVPAHQLPAGTDMKKVVSKGGKISEFDFAIEQKKTDGQYGKPAEYWQKWQEAIDTGTATQVKRKSKAGKDMIAYEMDSTVYQVQNTDLFDVWNTVLKIAEKRSQVASSLSLGCVGDLFTQDLEDYVDAHPVSTAQDLANKILAEKAAEERKQVVAAKKMSVLQKAIELGYTGPDGNADIKKMETVLKPKSLWPYQVELDAEIIAALVAGAPTNVLTAA